MTRKEWRDYPQPRMMGEEDAVPKSPGYVWLVIAGILVGSGLVYVMFLQILWNMAESLGAIAANWFSGGYP